MDYTYTKLIDVKVPGIFNVYGVIYEIIKVDAITQSGKKHSIITIIDETLPKGATFRLHFFLPFSFPFKLEKGSIIRPHRMKVEPWNDNFDGRVFRASDFVIFEGTGNSDFSYLTAAKNITLTAKDKARIEELREMLNINALFEEFTEEFGAAVTDSQRITFPGLNDSADSGGEENQNLRGNAHKRMNSMNENDADGPGDEESHIIEDTPCANLFLNPMNKKFRCLYEQKRLKGNIRESHDLAGTSASSVPKVSSKQYDLARKPPSDEDKAPGSENHLKRKSCSSDQDEAPDPINDSKRISLDPVQDRAPGPQNDAKRKSRSSDQDEAPDPVNDSKRISLDPVQDRAPGPQNDAKILSLDPVQDRAPGGECCDKSSMLVQNGSCDSSFRSPSCPGLACAGKDCVQEPIILGDDDPRLNGFRDQDLLTEGEGDIPGALENGEMICRPKEQYMPYGDGQSAIEVTAQDLRTFKWPEYRAKVKIVKIKPNLEALRVTPKNLLSATCTKCQAYTFYSHLRWKKYQGSKIKKPMCPVCFKAGREQFVHLGYRIKLTVRDAWGSELDIYAIEGHASTLLGFTPSEFIASAANQAKVLETLSEVIPSKSFINIKFCRVQTLIKVLYHIRDTKLKDMEQ